MSALSTRDGDPLRVGDMPVHYIETDAALRDAAARWRTRPCIALDSEFMRVRTFHAQAALFQLCDGEDCYLIDPVAISDLAPLADILRDGAIVKVMHSCSEDLEVCERRLGVIPEPLVDTQVIAAFCGAGLSTGYARMLEQEFDLRIEKSETRTDWLRRPLSHAQLHYAAEDVAHLLPLWERLRARLDGQPRLDWALEECAGILRKFRARDAVDGYRSVGGAWRMDRRTLAVLRAVYQWREETARRKDLPRNWVLPEEALSRLAQWRADDAGATQVLESILPGGNRRHAQAIEELIRAARALPDSELPVRLPPPLDARATRRVKRARALVEQRAQEIGMAAEMLARRRELEQLVRAIDDPAEDAGPLLQGWRRAIIGDALVNMLGSDAE